ncbi:precorrin-6y C5,15-methyltransferase (decarboxylating) subunit CbiE [Rhodococcus sp. D2-41]|uniref:precorrin-6y C5,15-methyltransferase (decarboxylating) subunit CbiE n=1 Tax=Speluncibacter jeojiensis TaxID=2710754 RepID=UPI00240F4187|nr:precorrin-6y C5,15-methyltransferase (decarboxylating) subunit CbiE [Rhodococcus sp. D2-41]MDG3011115.1 precorrin-6y C5,15-methyltransferase (decarboxylating) subunit CbiE [Rhodococcus sp. D2-41]
MARQVAVVGIGADGWDGLGGAARAAVSGATVVLGAPRQLALLPGLDVERVELPSPLLPALGDVVARHRDRGLCVLASGDPMFYGIGVTLARLLGAESLVVHTHPSSVSLAAARLGWALQEATVVSLVARPASRLVPELAAGRRLLVLSEGAHTPVAVAQVLRDNGFGESRLTVLAQLGGPDEATTIGYAHDWDGVADPLNVVAVECRGGAGRSRVPGLPDDAFETDGQLTKQEMRALTVSALAPRPGELLWDVGGGTGSIGIEWMRAHPDCRAIAFERDGERAARIARNAATLGVPGLVVRGAAPAGFADTGERPAAVFVGGGVTAPGMLEQCWSALRPGGRMVVNAVTIESEAAVIAWNAEHPGTLRKLQVYRGGGLGGFTAWRPQLPVTQWTGDKDTGDKDTGDKDTGEKESAR